MLEKIVIMNLWIFQYFIENFWIFMKTSHFSFKSTEIFFGYQKAIFMNFSRISWQMSVHSKKLLNFLKMNDFLIVFYPTDVLVHIFPTISYIAEILIFE